MPNPRLFDRAVIRLSPTEAGEDVRGFLQGLVTQDTNAEMPLWAGLLSPQGKVLFDFILWADGTHVLIDCEGCQAEALSRRLSMYRLRRKIAIVIDADVGVFWLPFPSVRAELVEGRLDRLDICGPIRTACRQVKLVRSECFQTWYEALIVERQIKG